MVQANCNTMIEFNTLPPDGERKELMRKEVTEYGTIPVVVRKIHLCRVKTGMETRNRKCPRV